MTNKEKCEYLRKVRIDIAKKLGLQNEIRQNPCDFKGECKGTCPACEKEERLLNKAMIGKAGLIAGTCLCLTACSPGTLAGDVVEAEPEYSISYSEELDDNELYGDIEVEELESYYEDEENEQDEYEGLQGSIQPL